MATQNYKNQLKGQNGTSFKKYWNGRGEKSENTIRIFCRKERLFDFFFSSISPPTQDVGGSNFQHRAFF